MSIKPIARTSLVAFMVLAGAFTPGALHTAELRTDRDSMSVHDGGWQRLSLHAGAESAGEWYLILGSVSGIQPGVFVQDVNIPLNFDFYTQFCLTRPNGGLIANQIGRLDSEGNAEALFYLPPEMAAGLVGAEVNHAFVVVNREGRITKVSNPASLTLTP